MIRKFLMLFLFSSILFSCNQTKRSEEQKEVILFVCEHGAARSPIAAAYFNKLAAEQGLNYTAVFRGTDPNTSLTTETEEGLKNDQLDINGWVPKKVSEKDIKEAYKVVTFDLTLPSTDRNAVSAVKWNGTPPISEDYDVARDIIVDHVSQLIEALPKAKQ